MGHTLDLLNWALVIWIIWSLFLGDVVADMVRIFRKRPEDNTDAR